MGGGGAVTCTSSVGPNPARRSRPSFVFYCELISPRRQFNRRSHPLWIFSVRLRATMSPVTSFICSCEPVALTVSSTIDHDDHHFSSALGLFADVVRCVSDAVVVEQSSTRQVGCRFPRRFIVTYPLHLEHSDCSVGTRRQRRTVVQNTFDLELERRLVRFPAIFGQQFFIEIHS